MSILVFNAGSSTLKFSLFDDCANEELYRGVVDWHGGSSEASLTLKSTVDQRETVLRTKLNCYGDAVRWVSRSLEDCGVLHDVTAVGHRVVHGANEFSDPVLIDELTRKRLETLTHLSRLHHPSILAAIDAARVEFSQADHVAVFDTAFFKDLPQRATTYPLPLHWQQDYGIRRFGFHGLSHSYCSNQATKMLGQAGNKNFRTIICHLGSGASVTAVVGGKPVRTTMGFTPNEGLMMGTRSGSVDPGLLVHLMQEHGFSAEGLEAVLSKKSGLLGVSGISSDYRVVEEVASDVSSPNRDSAKLAVDMFTDRIRSTIGDFAVTMGGVDAIVFTAGIGQNSRALRANVCQGLECLGVRLDPVANELFDADTDIAAADSSSRILVIATREEKVIAEQAKMVNHSLV